VPVPAAAALIYLAGASLGWLALTVARIGLATGLLVAGWLAALAGVLGLLLARVPVYDRSRHEPSVTVALETNAGPASADEGAPTPEPETADIAHGGSR
jgi:hypothetical protein